MRHGYNGGRIFDVGGGEAVTASSAGESGGSSQHSIFLLSILATRITRRGYARPGSRLPEGRRRGLPIITVLLCHGILILSAALHGFIFCVNLTERATRIKFIMVHFVIFNV